MAKEVSPYAIRRNRQPRKAQLTVLAEDADSNLQDDLQKYWRTVRKHLGLVLAVLAAFLTLTILHDMMTTPLYTASSTVLIRTNQPPLLENATVTIVSQGSQNDSGDADQTQIQLLKSKALAARVVAAEGLANDPSFVSKPSRGLAGTLRHNVVQWIRKKIGVRAAAAKSTPVSVASERSGLAGSYLSKLKITPILNTQMVQISFTTADPIIVGETGQCACTRVHPLGHRA